MLAFVWSLVALAILGAIGYGIYYYVHLHGFSGEMLTVIIVGWFFVLLMGTAAVDTENASQKGDNIFGAVMLIIIVAAILTYCAVHNVDLHLPFTIKRN